jgi:hypothetical protein
MVEKQDERVEKDVARDAARDESGGSRGTFLLWRRAASAPLSMTKTMAA